MTAPHRENGQNGDRRPRRRADGGMRAARRAARQLYDLTGQQPEGIVSVERQDEGWQVGVEVLELHRVPETTDLMAVYEVTLDGRGELVRCQRRERYHRGSPSEPD